MKEVQCISNVDNFLIVDKKLYFSNGKEVIGENRHSILISPLSLQFLNYKEPYFYIPDIYGNTYLIMENEVRFLKDIFIKDVISDSLLLVSKDKKTAVFDIKNNEFHYVLNFRIFKFLEWKKKYFLKNKNNIQGIEICTGQFLWEFSLSLLGKHKNPYTDEEKDFEVRRLIGIYNNILWVFLNAKGFIGLDIETGKLKYRIPEFHQAIGKTITSSYEDRKGFFRSDYLLDNEKGKIFGMAMDVFIEIDLTQEPPFVTQYGLQEEFEKYNIKKANDTAGSYVVQDNLLYFYLAEKLRFGILDINTKEIIYVSEPIAVVERDDSFTRLRDLKVSENKVYILDSNHTLHIFEREE